MIVTEIRKIRSDDLRQLCIEKNWYTLGNNEEYAEMLGYPGCDIHIESPDCIATLAEKIQKRSDDDRPLSSYCFEIAKRITSHFVIEEQ